MNKDMHKRIRKRFLSRRLLALTLALCLLAAPVLPAQALSLQETYYLQILYPNLPKNASSYPARLMVAMPNGVSVTLKGTCGMDASLTPEEMLAILKQALGAVKGYQELEDAAQDKHTQSQLTEKLKFTDEDVKEVMDNLLELIGMDDIPGMFNPIEMPDIEALNGDLFHDYELVNGAFEFGEQTGEIIDLLAGQGDLIDFVKPDLLPSIQDLLYNGAKISWEEFQKDQQKYKDIVTLYQAKQRLRTYYAKVDELVKNAQSENGSWAIRIYDQQVVDYKIMSLISAPTIPLIVSADIELVKDDGSYGNIGGTYTGSFKVDADGDFFEIDTNYHNMIAEELNSTAGASVLTVGGGTAWSGTSTTVNRPSEMKFALESAQAAVSLALPAGVGRTIFELPLDATALDANYSYVIDLVSEIQRREPDRGTTTWTYTMINEDDGETYRYYSIQHQAHGGCINAQYEPGHAYSMYGQPMEETQPSADIRDHIQMTLVVDML